MQIMMFFSLTRGHNFREWLGKRIEEVGPKKNSHRDVSTKKKVFLCEIPFVKLIELI